MPYAIDALALFISGSVVNKERKIGRKEIRNRIAIPLRFYLFQSLL
jgi:hypothetical protein